LISDNEETAAYLREKLIIEGGHSLSVEADASGGIRNFRDGNFDLVIVEFNDTAYLERAAFVPELKAIDPDLVVIAILEKDHPRLPEEMSRMGINDFVEKPIDAEELLLLIKKDKELHSLSLAHRKLTQSLRELNVSLEKQNTLLAKRIEESAKNLARLYEDLRATYMRTIKTLAQAIDARDHYTHSHSENVARCAVAIADQMHLPAKDIEIITEACELHDLGKIGLHDDILVKPGELTPREWELMKQHPLIAAQILEPLTFLQGAVELIRQHHEHYDGSGYPAGLVGEEILLGARIIHLSDAYDAMTSARAYRERPLLKPEAILEIKKNSGTQFDPKVIEAFLKIVDRL
jgi:response regulator RpfG family c-di-GMP phosphodiesterase